MSSSSRNILSSFASAFTQNNRILKLRFGPDSGIADHTLLPYRLTGSEHLSQCYRYDLDCLTSNGSLDPETLFGQAVQVDILQADGEHRAISGIVTIVEQRGSNGGFSRLGLIIEPALAALNHHFNSRIFQDKTVPDIAQTLLDDHLRNNPAVAKSFKVVQRLRKIYQPRSYCNQYRESVLACFERLLAEEGISYCFTFSNDSDTPVHTLVLFDDAYALDAAPQQRIRFHRADATEREDSIIDWQSQRQLHSGQSALASFDYKTVSVYNASRNAGLQQGKSGQQLSSTLEDYDPQAPYYGSSTTDIDRYARLRQQAKDMGAKTYSGQGTVRSLQAGTWFCLVNHPLHEREMPEEREFVVTSLNVEARNNLTQETKGGLAQLGLLSQTEADDESRPYANSFTAVRRSTPVVPLYSRTRHAKPTAPGLQTATVVGPKNGEIHTNEFGYIKVRLHWQRSQSYTGSDTEWEEQASTWVRVSYPSAGARWGHQFIPRVGQEVLIAYLESDIDRPVCIGGVYNGTHRPPTFSGVSQLPADRNLSGIKTDEIDGGRYNQLRLDDTTEQISAQLMSLHAHTELNLGWLGTPRQQGKSDPRGEGFGLVTDAAGAIRAAKGLLVSAWGRMQAGDKQLAREEFNHLLTECYELFAQLGKYAAENQAMELDPKPQEELKNDFKNWENGSNTAPKQEGGGKPIVGITAPAGISFATPANIVSYAAKNLDSVAQQHLQLTAGQRFNLNAGTGISLFSHKEGLKAIAHYGKLQLQAQHDDIVANASENIRFTATHGKIVGMADQEITFVTSGGAYLKLSGANVEIGCPGNLLVKSAGYDFVGPASMSTDLPRFEGGNPDQKFALRYSAGKEGLQQIAPNSEYEIKMTDGSISRGVSDASGKTNILQRDAMHIANIDILERKQ